MGILVVLIGMAVAFCFGISAIGADPISAPQQSVQALRFVTAAIGLLIASVGLIIYTLQNTRPLTAGESSKQISATVGSTGDVIDELAKLTQARAEREISEHEFERRKLILMSDSKHGTPA